MAKGQAALLPTSARASIWADLDPVGRSLLVQDLLNAHPELEPTGTIDYESPREPLFRNVETGELVSIAGQTFPDPGAPGEPLAVTVTDGRNPAPIIALLLIGGLLLLSARAL